LWQPCRANDPALRRFGLGCVIPTAIVTLTHKSLFGVRFLCPEKPSNPNVADEEKTDFRRIPINT
jgi:hypothetical protein